MRHDRPRPRPGAAAHGRNVYAIGQTGNALVVFDRSAATGDITPASCWTTSPPVHVGEMTDCGSNVTPALERPTGLAMSPDGENVYVTGAFTGTLGTGPCASRRRRAVAEPPSA